MPRETVTPRINLRGPDPEGGHYVPLPTVEVGWHRDLGSVQLGLETPVRMVGGDQSSGQHHLVDHLYADRVEDIGQHLIRLLDSIGRNITDDNADPVNRPEHNVELHPADLGRMVLDAVTGATPDGNPGGHAFTGWYTHLGERAEVNRLITLLRKARDAAFGKDA